MYWGNNIKLTDEQRDKLIAVLCSDSDGVVIEQYLNGSILETTFVAYNRKLSGRFKVAALLIEVPVQE